MSFFFFQGKESQYFDVAGRRGSEQPGPRKWYTLHPSERAADGLRGKFIPFSSFLLNIFKLI